MPTCCVVGCQSRDLRNRKLTFYIIPLEAKRRNLWLQAIQRANGNDERPAQNALICGAHFISGEVSMDDDSPDFVPSVFTSSKRKTAAQKLKRKHGSKCYTSSVETDKETSLPASELSEVKKEPSTPSLSKEVKTVSEEEEMENRVINIKSEAASSLQRISLSHEAAAIPKLGTRGPVILLKSVLNQAGAYQCDSCNQNFTVVSQFVKHKQQHDEERPLSNDVDVSVPLEISEKPVKSEAFTDHTLKDEHYFKCNMCERSFPTGQNLKRHKLLHLKDGRKCGQCGVLFCRRHSHILFRPQAVPTSGVEEDASADEAQPVNVNLTPENSQMDVKPNPKAEFADKSHDTMTAINQIDSPMSSKPEDVATISMSETTTICPLISSLIPDPKLLDPSRPPSPTLIRCNTKAPPYHFSPTPINYAKNYVQPHLPSLPELPPSLQMFSPQYLTSSFLEVKRNYACIFGKPLTVKEEPYSLPMVTPPQQQQHMKIKKERLDT